MFVFIYCFKMLTCQCDHHQRFPQTSKWRKILWCYRLVCTHIYTLHTCVLPLISIQKHMNMQKCLPVFNAAVWVAYFLLAYPSFEVCSVAHSYMHISHAGREIPSYSHTLIQGRGLSDHTKQNIHLHKYYYYIFYHETGEIWKYRQGLIINAVFM